jgi:hypothetical protein
VGFKRLQANNFADADMVTCMIGTIPFAFCQWANTQA